MRKLLGAKIHRATVTQSDLHYEGSIAIDQQLLEAANIVGFERVHIWNINTGARFETYAIEGARGSGEICLNGAAARQVQVGDCIIIATFNWIADEDLANYQPIVVLVDEKNRITQSFHPSSHPPVLAMQG